MDVVFQSDSLVINLVIKIKPVYQWNLRWRVEGFFSQLLPKPLILRHSRKFVRFNRRQLARNAITEWVALQIQETAETDGWFLRAPTNCQPAISKTVSIIPSFLYIYSKRYWIFQLTILSLLEIPVGSLLEHLLPRRVWRGPRGRVCGAHGGIFPCSVIKVASYETCSGHKDAIFRIFRGIRRSSSSSPFR
jgi:hypothetical protein